MTKATTKALELLVAHKGSCSVPDASPVHIAFVELSRTGIVLLRQGSTSGMVDVYIFNFQTPYEQKTEAPAH